MAIALPDPAASRSGLAPHTWARFRRGPRPAGGRESPADADNPVRPVYPGARGTRTATVNAAPGSMTTQWTPGGRPLARAKMPVRPEHPGRRGAPGPHGQGTMRMPAKTNGRPLETGAPNVLICLAERTEQLPMTARQIGGSAYVLPSLLHHLP